MKIIISHTPLWRKILHVILVIGMIFFLLPLVVQTIQRIFYGQ